MNVGYDRTKTDPLRGMFLFLIFFKYVHKSAAFKNYVACYFSYTLYFIITNKQTNILLKQTYITIKHNFDAVSVAFQCFRRKYCLEYNTLYNLL